MDVSFMEPMLPEEAALKSLESMALELVDSADKLTDQVHPGIHQGFSNLVRLMNCHHSNLIEGHELHLVDIERALNGDLSTDSRKRSLQLEAVAHIEVQRMIDEGRDPDVWPASGAYASWLHEEFCQRLPAGMLFIENPGTGQRHEIVPGQFREIDVQVGMHVPPQHADVPRFLARFDHAYSSPHLSRLSQIQSVGAVHHRFLWIHPFADGNGRVARLMSHALLKRLRVDMSLWSVSRALSLAESEYKSRLASADRPRHGDRDGRGNLTQAGLLSFCRFFLEHSVDQVRFMDSLIERSRDS